MRTRFGILTVTERARDVVNVRARGTEEAPPMQRQCSIPPVPASTDEQNTRVGKQGKNGVLRRCRICVGEQEKRTGVQEKPG